MYFLDLKSLVGDLKAERQTARESFQYAVGTFLFSCLNGLQGISSSSGEISTSKVIGTLIGVFIGAVIGYLILSYFYKCNGGDNGKHFLHRLLSLHFVVSMRVSIVFFPGLIATVVLALLNPQMVSSGTAYSVMLGLIVAAGIVAFVYWLSIVGNSLKEASGNKH